MWLRVSAIIFQLFKLILLEKCSNYPGIKLEQALGTWEDKIKHLSSYVHVVHTPAKLVISRRRKNEDVFKMSKNEKCTCKACKNTVFHCQICKFVGFLLPSSSWFLKLPVIAVSPTIAKPPLFTATCRRGLTLSLPRRRVKSSGVRQSKIYKCPERSFGS